MAEQSNRSSIGTFAAIGGAIGAALSFMTGDWAVWTPAGGALGVAAGFAKDYMDRSK